MNITFIINTVALVTSILLLIFSSFVMSQWKERKLSSVMLAGLLLSISFHLINFIFPTIQESLDISAEWFSEMGAASVFLFGPFIFLYTVSITDKNFKFTIKDTLHFLIYVIVTCTVLTGYYIEFPIKYGLFNLQVFTYLVACLFVIKNYRIKIKEYFSTIDKIKLTWLLYVIAGFFLMWITDLINTIHLIYGTINKRLTDNLNLLSISINFIFTILIYYKTLRQPEFLFNIQEEVNIPKYESSKLSSEEKEKFLRKIEDYVKEDKPYLSPTITIRDISKSTDIPVKYISQVINESLNKNFYDFINSYRIDEAINQLIETEGKEKTILQILYNSGFNSKSAFNTAFKKHTGFTPTEFRNQKVIA